MAKSEIKARLAAWHILAEVHIRGLLATLCITSDDVVLTKDEKIVLLVLRDALTLMLDE